MSDAPTRPCPDSANAHFEALMEIRRIANEPGDRRALIDRIYGIATEACRHPAQCAWKPIETAPKIYRQRILVFRPDAKRYPVIGEDYWSDIYQQGCWAMSPSDEQPTHWMPLPAAPSVSSTVRDSGLLGCRRCGGWGKMPNFGPVCDLCNGSGNDPDQSVSSPEGKS